jgi:acetyl-CoA carboxylase carboxyltransferase component
MGPEGAIEILEGKKIKEFTSPDEATKFIAEKEKEYRNKFANPYEAARYGYIDDVIEPRNTRFRIIRALQAISTKKDTLPAKKHNNMPL